MCLLAIAAYALLPQEALSQNINYDQLVAQAQTDLKAGNAAQALTESQEAIAAAPSRWEAYVVAGGALQVEHQYDSAADDFTKALEYAPEAKKAAVRGLLEKCIRAQDAAQATPAPASTASTPPAQPALETSVTQAEVVLWKTIQDSTSPSDFQAYLQQYPNGAFVALARQRLEQTQAARQKPEEQLSKFSGTWRGAEHNFDGSVRVIECVEISVVPAEAAPKIVFRHYSGGGSEWAVDGQHGGFHLALKEGMLVDDNTDERTTYRIADADSRLIMDLNRPGYGSLRNEYTRVSPESCLQR